MRSFTQVPKSPPTVVALYANVSFQSGPRLDSATACAIAACASAIEQAGPELFMFSTDYPHPEGGKNPLAKFEEELTTTSPADQSRFYCGNMSELLTGNPALVDAG